MESLRLIWESSTLKARQIKRNNVNIDLIFFSAKIKNIEATEEAKLKMIKERSSKKDLPSQFVPTNMAVNFVQHNRCNYYLFILGCFVFPLFKH